MSGRPDVIRYNLDSARPGLEKFPSEKVIDNLNSSDGSGSTIDRNEPLLPPRRQVHNPGYTPADTTLERSANHQNRFGSIDRQNSCSPGRYDSYDRQYSASPNDYNSMDRQASADRYGSMEQPVSGHGSLNKPSYVARSRSQSPRRSPYSPAFNPVTTSELKHRLSGNYPGAMSEV